MGQVERISVEVRAEVAEALREVVARGEFATLDDAVNEALTGWQIDRAVALGISDDELRAILAETPADDDPGRPADEVLDELAVWLDAELPVEGAIEAGTDRRARRA